MLRVADQWHDSDLGRQRRGNEDRYFVQSPLFVVADGMGGAQAGEVASELAVKAFRSFVLMAERSRKNGSSFATVASTIAFQSVTASERACAANISSAANATAIKVETLAMPLGRAQHAGRCTARKVAGAGPSIGANGRDRTHSSATVCRAWLRGLASFMVVASAMTSQGNVTDGAAKMRRRNHPIRSPPA